MGIFNILKRKKTEPVRSNETKDDDSFGIPLSSLGVSGDNISISNALKIETVYSCIRDKSETVGRLPVRLYDKDAKGRVNRVEQGRLYKIFTEKPCSFMTMQGFLEFAVASYELYGAFYAYVAYNDRGNIMEIIPIKNQHGVTPQMDINGNVYYQYVTNDGKPVLVFNRSDLFIINQFTLNGFTPVSPITQNGQLLNSTFDTERTWGKLQSDGITSQFALKTDKSLKADAAIRLKKDWKVFRGAPGVNNIPVLEDGMDVRSLQLSPKDAEMLSAREYSVNRICRIFRVPPERIGVPKSTSSKTTLLEIDEFYMRNSIEPVLVKVEFALNSILAKCGVKKNVKFNRKSFYNGSPHRMVEALSAELKVGGCTVNELRIDLGRDPVEGGDVFAIDTNNLTFGSWSDLPSQADQQKPTGENEDE